MWDLIYITSKCYYIFSPGPHTLKLFWAAAEGSSLSTECYRKKVIELFCLLWLFNKHISFVHTRRGMWAPTQTLHAIKCRVQHRVRTVIPHPESQSVPSDNISVICRLFQGYVLVHTDACVRITEVIDLCDEWIDRLLRRLVVLWVKDRLGQGQPNDSNRYIMWRCVSVAPHTTISNKFESTVLFLTIVSSKRSTTWRSHRFDVLIHGWSDCCTAQHYYFIHP